MPTDELIDLLGRTEPGEAQRALLREQPGLREREVVLRIADAVAQVARQDVARAERLAAAASWLAELLNDDFCRARGARARANVCQQSGRYAEAEESYSKALALFEHIGDEIEIGRTLASSLQPLIYLGKYAQAFLREQRAREIFTLHHDRLRLARLDINLGNILHRQDRFDEALVVYRRADRELAELGEADTRALALLNIAVCSISLHDYEGALDAYRQTRKLSAENNMPLIAAQADYNIAYLHYYRGEYTQAIEQYQSTAALCQKIGDAYHAALCDMDRAELYLDLRLTGEASHLAQQALSSFSKLQLNYECAKSLVFRGLAAHQHGQPFLALEHFAKARKRYEAEHNRPWPAILDLFSAIVLYREGRLCEAQRSCRKAQEVLDATPLHEKAVAANLLGALLSVKLRDMRRARTLFEAARAKLKTSPAALNVLAIYVYAETLEGEGDLANAYSALRTALDSLSRMPGQRHADDLKIPILERPSVIHESLVSLAGELPPAVAPDSQVFSVMESAKSREIAELVAFRAQSLPAPAETRSSLVEQVRKLREELNWYYRQINVQEMRDAEGSTSAVELRERATAREKEFAGALQNWSHNDAEFLSLQSGESAPFEDICASVPKDASFIHYYLARGSFYAAVLDSEGVELFALSGQSRIQEMLHDLRRQHARYVNESARTADEDQKTLKTVRETLYALHAELFAPLRKRITNRHVIVSPHHVLHSVPFDALFDGKKYLIDSHCFSYTLTGSLFSWLEQRDRVFDRGTLIVSLDEENQSAAGAPADIPLYPPCDRLSRENASLESLQQSGADRRFILWHTSAEFRHDNPLFSTLQLGKQQIRLLDLYQLRLPAEIVYLTGCEPGIETSGEGRATIAMLRGFFYAGAETVLIGLWPGSTVSSTHWSRLFVERLRAGVGRASSLRSAIMEVRQRHRIPFDWAAPMLWGASGPVKA
jgi:CHAT domain-containing protein/Tfp pilus assembly protein PilF